MADLRAEVLDGVPGTPYQSEDGTLSLRVGEVGLDGRRPVAAAWIEREKDKVVTWATSLQSEDDGRAILNSDVLVTDLTSGGTRVMASNLDRVRDDLRRYTAPLP